MIVSNGKVGWRQNKNLPTANVVIIISIAPTTTTIFAIFMILANMLLCHHQLFKNSWYFSSEKKGGLTESQTNQWNSHLNYKGSICFKDHLPLCLVSSPLGSCRLLLPPFPWTHKPPILGWGKRERVRKVTRVDSNGSIQCTLYTCTGNWEHQMKTNQSKMHLVS